MVSYRRSRHSADATSRRRRWFCHEDIAMTSLNSSAPNPSDPLSPSTPSSAQNFRRDYITKPIFGWAKTVLPTMSDTEREALEAGDVWWDADLFTGNPDWSKLLATAPATLTPEENDFLNGTVDELCAMLDDWKINWEWRDLPPEVWAFIKEKKFLGMIIPKEYGGLGFSPYAHSEVVRKISSRSLAAAVTVMVPNSLGPGELLMRFGTKDQQQTWLPRLADGRVVGVGLQGL
jgi:acyl-CoA dehydrogenase